MGMIHPLVSVGRNQYEKNVFSLEYKEDCKGAEHEVNIALSVAALLGAGIDNPELRLWPSPLDETFVSDVLKNRGIKDSDFTVGINPNANQSGNLWRQESFAEVADLLVEKYSAKIIFFGGPADKANVNSIQSKMKHSSIDFSGIFQNG